MRDDAGLGRFQAFQQEACGQGQRAGIEQATDRQAELSALAKLVVVAAAEHPLRAALSLDALYIPSNLATYVFYLALEGPYERASGAARAPCSI